MLLYLKFGLKVEKVEKLVAKEVIRLIEEDKKDFRFCYEEDMSIKEKINAIATKIYGADGVDFTAQAEKEIQNLEKLGFGNLPICMAKTQYSLSDDPTKLGRPTGFRVTVRQLTVSAGAGFIVALTGDIMKMPGLPKVPCSRKNRCRRKWINKRVILVFIK